MIIITTFLIGVGILEDLPVIMFILLVSGGTFASEMTDVLANEE